MAKFLKFRERNNKGKDFSQVDTSYSRGGTTLRNGNAGFVEALRVKTQTRYILTEDGGFILDENDNPVEAA